MVRTVGWFSCGDASAVACAIALKERPETAIVRIVITAEHSDNDRFAADCARWYGQDIVCLASTAYADPWAVWEKRRYIAGIKGAPCTTELKKAVRFKFQRADDVHVMGYTVDELNRVERFRKENPEIDCWFPLVEHGLKKADCHALIRAQGIELPAMYRLGFGNNNCIGCPKGGAGYWNKIRIHFPAQFARMAELSRRLGARIVQQDGERCFLDELRTTTGRQRNEVEIECSVFCMPVMESFAANAKA